MWLFYNCKSVKRVDLVWREDFPLQVMPELSAFIIAGHAVPVLHWRVSEMQRIGMCLGEE